MNKNIVEPRRILISWRPEKISEPTTLLTTEEWVGRLKLKLKHARVDEKNRPIEVIDRGIPGDSVAADRDVRSYTDFIAVYSDDYCEQCEKEASLGTSNELLNAVKRLHDTLVKKSQTEAAHIMSTNGFNLWVAPINKGRFKNAVIGGQKPWSEIYWHFLKKEGNAFTLKKQNLSYDDELAENIAEPIIKHSECGPACETYRPKTDSGTFRFREFLRFRYFEFSWLRSEG